MNKFASKLILLTVAIVTVVMVMEGMRGADEETTGRWFGGVGTGTNPDQIPIENKVVEKYNASQSDIELKINIVDNKTANDALGTLFAANNAPDIVGPVGFAGANTFTGQWLDLKPLVDKNKVDLKAFPDSLVQLYTTPDGLGGIPFAVFPGLMYYNADLFDEASLAYPPSKVGDKYKPDGKDVDWSWDTVAT